MAARVGLSQGAKYGVALSAGIALGACIWAVTALMGLSVLFDYAPALLNLMKILGGAYLIYMAVQMWRHAKDPIENTTDDPDKVSVLSAVRLGVVTQLANPKPAVFFGAVFINMIPDGTTNWALALLILFIFTGEFLWCALVTRIFSLERTRRTYMGFKHLIDRMFGGMLGALGIKIAAF
jgi:threonine/homoserine/homoserine lactone efflux protein